MFVVWLGFVSFVVVLKWFFFFCVVFNVGFIMVVVLFWGCGFWFFGFVVVI